MTSEALNVMRTKWKSSTSVGIIDGIGYTMCYVHDRNLVNTTVWCMNLEATHSGFDVISQVSKSK